MAVRLSTFLSHFRRAILVVGLSALAGVVLAGIALPMVAGVGITAREGADAFTDMPNELKAKPMAQRSQVLDADGNRLALFYAENREYVGLKKIADVMEDAVLAIEDDRFFDRGPIDFQGTLRALINNLNAGEVTGGGSTLTQQYVKQVRLAQAKTKKQQQAVLASTGTAGYKRKLEELRMAVAVEEKVPKKEILERYLNIVYFGNGAYGVEAAARTYFGKPASKLNLRQASLLAGLIQNPLRYDPTDNPDAARNRRDTVLNRMAETERITEAAAAKARKKALSADISRPSNGCIDSAVGFFCDYLVHEIKTMKELGDSQDERLDTLLRGGLTIQSTLDLDTQDAAQEAVSDQVAAEDSAIGSLASIEPETGYIEAMANSREYGIDEDKEGVSNLNYAVDWAMGGGNGMQPGSSFKPYVLAAALDQGISAGTSINSPSPWSGGGLSWKTCDGWAPAEYGWNPKNSTGPKEGGTFNLRTGTQQSINTFYIQLSKMTGLCQPARIAEKSGVHRANAGQLMADGTKVPRELEQVPSFTLGVNLVSPLSMAQGYATFSNDGIHCPATGIVTIKNATGKTLVDHTKPKCTRVLDESVADEVTDILQSVMTGGTGSRAQLDGVSSAGKTGTTNDGVAVWFVGYTDDFATAVAVADVDGQLTSLDGRTFNGEYVGEACGGCLPGPVWKDFMDDVN